MPVQLLPRRKSKRRDEPGLVLEEDEDGVEILGQVRRSILLCAPESDFTRVNNFKKSPLASVSRVHKLAGFIMLASTHTHAHTHHTTLPSSSAFTQHAHPSPHLGKTLSGPNRAHLVGPEHRHKLTQPFEKRMAFRIVRVGRWDGARHELKIVEQRKKRHTIRELAFARHSKQEAIRCRLSECGVVQDFAEQWKEPCFDQRRKG
jgi:hypothetical protein